MITATCGAYVLWELFQYPIWEATELPFWSLLWRLSLVASVYAASTVLLGLAWWLILTVFEPHKMGWLRSVGVFGASQLAKYLPSNVLHLVGRYALSRVAGLSRTTIVVSTGLEPVGLTAVAVLAVGFSSVALLDSQFPGFAYIWAIAATAALGMPTLVIVARRRFGGLPLVRLFPEVDWRRFQGRWILIELLYGTFFFVAALVVVVLCDLATFAGKESPDLGVVLGVVCAAWIAGTFTPGAPGGLGVRESVLILGFSRLMNPGDAVFVATTFRIVTIAGDCLMFFVAQLALKKSHGEIRA